MNWIVLYMVLAAGAAVGFLACMFCTREELNDALDDNEVLRRRLARAQQGAHHYYVKALTDAVFQSKDAEDRLLALSELDLAGQPVDGVGGEGQRRRGDFE